MDALLIALLGCLLAELGDKGQLLTAALATRYRANGAVIAGIVVATAFNAAIGAVAGAWIGPMLGSDARLLFLALAILFLGAGLLWRVTPPDTLDGWPTGAFLTSALGLFILGFGDGSQFLIMAVVTRTADPLLAGIGGWIGMSTALIVAAIGGRAALRRLPIRAIRYGGAGLCLLTGAAMALTAAGLM